MATARGSSLPARRCLPRSDPTGDVPTTELCAWRPGSRDCGRSDCGAISAGCVAQDGCHTVGRAEVVGDHDGAAVQQRVACECVDVVSDCLPVDERGGNSALGDRGCGGVTALDPQRVTPEFLTELSDSGGASSPTLDQRLFDRSSTQPVGDVWVVAGAGLHGDDSEAVRVEMIDDGGGLAIVAGQDDELGTGVDGVLGDLAGNRVGVAFVHCFGAPLVPGLITAGVTVGLDMIALDRGDLGEVEAVEFEEIGTKVVDHGGDDRRAFGQLIESSEHGEARPDLGQLDNGLVDQPAERSIDVVSAEQHRFTAPFESLDEFVEVGERCITGAGIDEFGASDVPTHHPIVAQLPGRRELHDHGGVWTWSLGACQYVFDRRQLDGGAAGLDLRHVFIFEAAAVPRQSPRSRPRSQTAPRDLWPFHQRPLRGLISARDVNSSHEHEPGHDPAEEGGPMVIAEATVGSTLIPAVERGRWVVGLDGSECAANALEWTAANIGGRAADVELVTAWQTPVIGAYPMAAPVVVPFDDSEFHDAAVRDVAAVASDLSSRLDVPVTATVGHGGPAQVLLEASASAALLVIGSRGRGGFARLLLGSTSTQCATHASVPTVVVPGDVEPKRAERILVGCDGSPNSMVALRWAIQFAAPGGTVVAAWVWDATPLAVGADAFFFPDASDLAAERFHHLVDTVADRARAADVTLKREFIRGTPRSALASQAENVDLVAVGACGHGAVGAALLGSVSTWLLHHVHRPIAVVPLSE